MDSASGLFSALAFGPFYGAFVCGVEHILSAARSGFPLGAFHIVVALLMAATGASIGIVGKRFGTVAGLVVGVIINTAGVPLAVPVYGWGILPVLTLILAMAASINAVPAGMVYRSIKRMGVLKSA